MNGQFVFPANWPAQKYYGRFAERAQPFRSFDEVKGELRDRVIAEKAADLIYDRANKLDNLLASLARARNVRPADNGG